MCRFKYIIKYILWIFIQHIVLLRLLCALILFFFVISLQLSNVICNLSKHFNALVSLGGICSAELWSCPHGQSWLVLHSLASCTSHRVWPHYQSWFCSGVPKHSIFGVVSDENTCRDCRLPLWEVSYRLCHVQVHLRNLADQENWK